jgi:hypothetical protein
VAATLPFVGQPYSELAAGGELEFRMLVVDPACQGAGVGRAVVRSIVEHARRLPSIEAISITSVTFVERAHGLYRSLASAARPSATGTFLARTCRSGYSGWSCTPRRLSVPEPTLNNRNLCCLICSAHLSVTWDFAHTHYRLSERTQHNNITLARSRRFEWPVGQRSTVWLGIVEYSQVTATTNRSTSGAPGIYR